MKSKNRYLSSTSCFTIDKISSKVAALVLLAILFVCADTKDLADDKRHTIKPHTCPTCNLGKKYARDELANNHKIVSCTQYNDPMLLAVAANTYGKNHSLPSYRCKCHYLKNCDDSAPGGVGSGRDYETESSYEYPDNNDALNECLVAHVGMAVKGYNLIYKKWISEENCFNLCMSTSKKNGHLFDCTSFEHWQSDCGVVEQNSTTSFVPRICSLKLDSKVGDKTTAFLTHRNHRHHRGQRAPVNKIEYCVLSNQTIASAGTEFTHNHAVTYYELLCTRPTEVGQASSTAVVSTTPTYYQEPHSSSTSKRSTTKGRSSKSTKKKPPKLTTTTPIDLPSTILPSKTSSSHKNSKTSTIGPGGGHGKRNTSSSHKKCDFTPCQNEGECRMTDGGRFTCICKIGFYGDYCQHNSIGRTCHQTHMEILIHSDLMSRYRVNASSFYVNHRLTSSSCKIKPYNDNQFKFSLPYDKCATTRTSTELENVYINNLYYYKGSDHFVANFECRIDKASPSTTPSMMVTSKMSIKNVCIVDLLNLKIKLFRDTSYSKEIKTSESINAIERISQTYDQTVEYDRPIYVQFSVFHSDKLNTIYDLQDKLRYFFLTLERCWLTSTQNSNGNVLQVLIQNGCPKENVHFDKYPVKSSIRFWFTLSKQFKAQKLTQFYLHCLPEVCNDVPIKSPDRRFFSDYKSCHNISEMCQEREERRVGRSNSTAFKHNDHHSPSSFFAKSAKANRKMVVKRGSNYENNFYQKMSLVDDHNSEYSYGSGGECKNKFSLGPVYLVEERLMISSASNLNSVNLLVYRIMWILLALLATNR